MIEPEYVVGGWCESCDRREAEIRRLRRRMYVAAHLASLTIAEVQEVIDLADEAERDAIPSLRTVQMVLAAADAA